MLYIFKHIFFIFLFINVYDRAPAEADDEVGVPLNMFKPTVLFYITDSINAVFLIWFSMFACYVAVSVLFSPSTCLDDKV